MIVSVLQILVYWLISRRFEKLHLIMLAFIMVLGGATLIFHEAIFIKWKPSVIYWILGLFLLFSHFIGKKPIMHRMLADKIELPHKIWGRLNFAWGIFFIFMGCLNLYVVYHYSTNAWVNFKLFGALGLTLLFLMIQMLYLSRYIKLEKRDK